MKNLVLSIIRSLRPRNRSISQPSHYTKPPPNPNRDFQAALCGSGVTGFENFN